jgi:hypothetical protein
MHQYDARQQFIDGVERYLSGIETEEGLSRLARTSASTTIQSLRMLAIWYVRSCGP